MFQKANTFMRDNRTLPHKGELQRDKVCNEGRIGPTAYLVARRRCWYSVQVLTTAALRAMVNDPHTVYRRAVPAINSEIRQNEFFSNLFLMWPVFASVEGFRKFHSKRDRAGARGGGPRCARSGIVFAGVGDLAVDRNVQNVLLLAQPPSRAVPERPSFRNHCTVLP